jgi:putative phosphoesterase
MRIAILSDIHDNVWKLDAALKRAEGAGVLICCGDLCSPFIVHQIGRGFAKPVHIVFGNNDGDLFRIANNARQYSQIRLHGSLFRGDFDGKRFAVNHYDDIGRAIAASGEFDVVCFGHNHCFEIGRAARTLMINPGAVMGATFAADGSRTDVASTMVIYESETDEAEKIEL